MLNIHITLFYVILHDMSLYDRIIEVINKYNNDEQLIERVREIIYNDDMIRNVNFSFGNELEFMANFRNYLEWSNLSLLSDLIKLLLTHPDFKRIMKRSSTINHIASHYSYECDHLSPTDKTILLEIFRLIWNNCEIIPETNIISQYNITSPDLLEIIFSNPEFKRMFVFNGYAEYANIITKAFIDRNPYQFIYLLESNMIDPGVQNNRKFTILHMMCLWNYMWPYVLKLYMNHPKFCPNIVNFDEHTILDYICMNLDKNNICASHELAVDFLEHPQIMKLPKNPIHMINSNILSITNDDLRNFIKLLLNSNMIDINVMNRFDNNCLYYVCEYTTDVELIRIFLEYPDISLSIEKSNFLKTALRNRNVFEFLLSDDRIDLSSHGNNTHILFEAIKNSNVIATKLILDHPSVKSFPPLPQSNFYFLNNMYDILVEISQHPKSSDLFNFDFSSHINIDKLCFFERMYTNSLSVSSNEMAKITELLLSKCTHDLFLADSNFLLRTICEHGLYSSFMCILNAHPSLDLSDFKLIYRACSFTINYMDHSDAAQRLAEGAKLIKFLGSHPQIKCQLTTLNQYGAESLFHTVCTYHNIEIFEALLEVCEDIIVNDPTFINTKNSIGKTMFNVALSRTIYGDAQSKYIIRFIQRLLKYPFIDFITPDMIQRTPIDHFCTSVSYGNLSEKNMIEVESIIRYMVENIEGFIIPSKSINHNHKMDTILDKFRNK